MDKKQGIYVTETKIFFPPCTRQMQQVFNKNKPTKSGVDNMDHLARLYTCKRKIKRWPMTIFFDIVNIVGIAAFVIWAASHPDWMQGKTYKRRLFLKDLAFALVED